MSGHKSPEEVRAAYVAAMGEELGGLFHVLSNELTSIHVRWKQYRILFGDKPSRVDLLNEAAPFFFRTVQDVLFEETLLAIARLVGPAGSRGKPNLSVMRLPELIEDQDRRAMSANLVASAVSAAAFASDWRNRHIAHRDLDLSLRQAARPLEPASRQSVEAALESLRTLMNEVERAYMQATTAYDLASVLGGAETLLDVVRDGVAAERDRRSRWQRGEIREEDLKPPTAV